MRSILSAVILWLTFGPAVQAQGAPCAVLSRMRQADVALQAIASRGGGGAETQAAILWLIGEEGPASGLDPGFVTDFLAAHDAALDALTRGAPVETVLAEPALRRSGERVSRYVSLFRCGNSGGVPVAGAQPLPAVDVGTGGVTPGAIPGAAWPVAGPLAGFGAEGRIGHLGPGSLVGGGRGGGRFPAPDSLGEDPWRADTQPWVYRFLSIFFLVFAAALGLFDWLRRIRHRRARRRPCLLPVTVARRGRRFRGSIVELSRVGAVVRLDGRPLRRGVHVTVEAEGREVAARVVWVNAHFIGISFATALANATHDAFLAAGQPLEPASRQAA